ncbi:MAG: HAMP domain-containing protein, partial [Hyphomonadaceae bacterium]|nr:HAMP domain-containing protein [Hyphomonadaceae bacterium]
MVHHVALSDPTQTAPVLSDRPHGRSAITFAAGYALAALLTAVSIVVLVTGEGLTGEAIPYVQVMLAASLVLSAGLIGILAHRVLRIARAWRLAATGARLHVRFVTMFSLAALAPAVFVAAFLGFTFSQGVERWFSARIATSIENAADVGRAYVDLASGDLSGEVLAMAEDLNLAVRGLTEDPERYRAFLAAQAQARALASAYVIRRDGDVLARAEGQEARGYERPSAEAFATADQGSVSIRFDQDDDRVVAVFGLSAYQGAYLVATRAVAPGVVTQLRQFDQALVEYRTARAAQSSLRTLFSLAYFSTALLVLLGAVWLGLSSATRIAEPIGRLADAARRVAAGDLKARVSTGDERDEVDALASAFNRMTAQLETQRRDLVAAQEQSESRRRFLETVLGGVSAGVIGLDRDGRISAANRSAALLLGFDEGDLVGRRLMDAVPEFAELLNQPAPQAETPAQRIDIVREGQSTNLSVRMGPDAEGGLVLTFDDMTKLISAQRQEAWKDVARRIAHEIKNPLTPIQLSAERLRRKYSDEIKSDQETFQRCTDTSLRQVADIGRMVDEFSAFA